MRKALIPLIAAVLLLWSGVAGAGQWFKQAARLHVGAHGHLACAECHPGKQPPDHPTQAGVAQDPRARFDPALCYQCHAEVREPFMAGSHGAGSGRAGRIGSCLACHDPHYAYQRANPPADFLPGAPRSRQCGACHQARRALPPPRPGDQACFRCHVYAGPAPAPARVDSLCLACHGAGPAGQAAPRMAGGRDDLGPHAGLHCAACHGDLARFPHRGRVENRACLACHPPHDQAVSGDAHLRVSCAACHLAAAKPVLTGPGGMVRARVARAGGPTAIHALAPAGEPATCRRCHTPGNRVGAAAMVLPPKGVLCMPCHPATLTLAGWPSRTAVLFLALGLAGFAGLLLSGRRHPPGAGRHPRAAAGRRWAAAARALVLDGLLQRRLWAVSPLRGLLHGLIFLPLLARFGLGLFTLVLSLAWPGLGLSRALMDQNQPALALFYDLTGLMMLVGGLGALLRRRAEPGRRLPGLPGADWPGLALLGLAVVSGFVAEAARMALAGWPGGGGYAFVGHALSRAFAGVAGLDVLYGYLWYAHAIAWAAFVAWLPFGRMLHILLAPVSLALRAADDAGRSRDPEP